MKKKIIITVLAIVAIISIIIFININKKSNIKEEKIIFDANNTGYKFENSGLYVQLNKTAWVRVPGDFTQMIQKLQNQKFEENTYQISDYKIVFYYTTEYETGEKYDRPTKYSQDGTKVLETEQTNEVKYNSYLIYSDDFGKTWNTTQPSPVGENTMYMHFVNKQIGYVVNILDVAMQSSLVSLEKTVDGGATWNEVSNIEMKINSKIEFVTENIGFYTKPRAGEKDSELYMTSDAGKTWHKVDVLQSEIYDYYNLPESDGQNLKLVISQGSDGDYNGGDYKEYYSDDYGTNWKIKD